MPEGDTIHRTAAALRTALVGRPIVRFEAPGLIGPSPAHGRVIEHIESHGKHLEVLWDDGLTLHTNLRLSGAWHLYRVGERWRRNASEVRVVIAVSDWIAVCFNAPVVETYRHFDRSRHPGFGPLGPDLCAPDADLEECINRIYHYADQEAPLADVLLDEHVLRSLGNVYRSEVLWACGFHPLAKISTLDAEDCMAIVAVAARTLRGTMHVAGDSTLPTLDGPQPTFGNATRPLGVYGRNGQRCSHCGDTIEVSRLGDLGRLVYWCPGCQLRHGPQHQVSPPADDRPMDPHPAAAKYLSQLPWRRNDPLAG